uniref:SMP-30/gluconolactonase/LRE family protein n=1 Tax=uncultured Halomonas sp. TaxID=173971 RepID=UPI0026194DCA|nr:SMP-30/gluconolactonase/LRE family protein [uncultured Halomonas sp.]
MAEPELLIEAQAELGESPVWDPVAGCLLWADLYAPAIESYRLSDGKRQRWPLPETLGAFGRCTDGRLIVAMRSGIYRFEPNSEALDLICCPYGEPKAGTRFNDGKVAPNGRFVIGTMDEQHKSRPLGCFYSVDSNGQVDRISQDLIVANGLAWSPDGRRVHFSDTRRDTLYVADYCLESGEIYHPRVMAVTDPDLHGRPDGGATDNAGGYWSAGVFGGVLNYWDHHGQLARQVRLPCPGPTMPCFGGPDMKTLFVTTLRKGLTPSALAAAPLSGSVFALEVEVPGVPVAAFGG